jgi:hypothetical protein
MAKKTEKVCIHCGEKVATGVDNTSAQTVTTKVLINDQLYLLRDGKMYTVQGQVVR